MALTPEQEAVLAEIADAEIARRAFLAACEAHQNFVRACKARLEDPEDSYNEEDYCADMASNPPPTEEAE